MTKWAQDASALTVLVMRNRRRKTSSSRTPKPILDRSGNPDRLKFTAGTGTLRWVGRTGKPCECAQF